MTDSACAKQQRPRKGEHARIVVRLMKFALAALVAASLLVFSAAAQAAGPSAASLKKALRSDVKRSLSGAAKVDLATAQSKGFTLKRVRGLTAGKVSVSARANGITVVKGSRTFARRGRASIKLKASRSGKRLMRPARRITLTVKATFAPRDGKRVVTKSTVTLARKPLPTATAPLAANARLIYFETFDTAAPWSGLGTQCAHRVGWGKDNGDGYARFEVRPGEPTVAGHERCEVSHGGFGNATPPGEYWYRTRERAGVGFPQAAGSDNWANIQQWHEDEPAPGADTGPVDGAIFVNSGPAERMLIEGDHLDFLQAPVFDIHAWHDFVVHGVWTDQPNGYLEWWIDGVYVGRRDGVTSETGGRHFWKAGIERADGINTLQRSDVSSVEIYKVP
jgi:hypothetical protein